MSYHLKFAHKEYLQSSTWKDIRLRILQRDGYKCCRCGQSGNEVHHKTYERWGRELDSDLETLCSACHYSHHSAHKGTGNNKTSIGNRAINGYLSQSQKDKAIKTFKLAGPMSLYIKICLEPDDKICLFCAKMLGYKNWYNQIPNSSGDKKTREKKSWKAGLIHY